MKSNSVSHKTLTFASFWVVCTTSTLALGQTASIKTAARPDVAMGWTIILDGGTIPSIADDKKKECIDPGVSYVRLHIKKHFFLSLPFDQICTAAGHPPAQGCWRDANADQSGQSDDDGKDGKPIAPPQAPAATTDIDWHTPLDLDVTPYFKDAKKNYVQIKIILDDPDMAFMQTQTSTPDPSAQAIKQGTNGTGMFLCRSPIHARNSTYPPTGKLDPATITVRVKRASQVSGHPTYGGLNIGILYTIGDEVLPLYIDPKLPNEG